MADLRPGRGTAAPDLFSAVGRHFLLFLLPIVVLVGGAVAYGLIRSPQYKAETKVSIGQLALSTQGIPGFLTAAGNLAAAYSRAVDAPQVARAAARAGGVSPSDAAESVSSSAIPDTPLFRVEVTSSGEERSVKMANAATKALIDHIRNLNRRANLRDQVLGDYKRAALKVAQLKLEIRRNPRSASLRQRHQVGLLRQNALGNLYYGAVGGQATQNLLQVIVRARDASSDRNDTLAKLVLVGALAGLLIGLLLVAGRASRQAQRAPVE